MSKYISTKRNNPCPLCHDTTGDCRTFAHSDNVMCKDGVGGSLSDSFYRYTRDSSNGRWGVYVLIDPDYKTPSEEAIKARKERQEAEEKARRERFWASLSNSDRNKNYLAIHKKLGLLSSDKEQLKKRGLTDEQIEKGKFFSIRGQSELPLTVSLQFAGVNPHNATSNSIGYSKTNGFSCPARSYEGEIIGYQIRNNNPNEEFSAKYYWAKSRKIEGTEVTSHLQNGELPLTFHGTGQETLYIVEGILKPYIAHCLHGIDVVGAAGGQWSSSPQQLIHIAKNYKEIVVIPDGGAIENKNICNQIKNVKELILKELNKEIKIAWYEQYEKSDGDIDEIESFEPTLITFDTWEFISNTIVKKEFDVDAWRSQKKKELRQFHKELKKGTEANFKFNARYWDYELIKNEINKRGIFNSSKPFVLGLRGAKGTGKSEIIKRLKKLLKVLGFNLIVISPRRALCEEFSAKLEDVKFINNATDNKTKHYFASNYEDIACCIDSIQFLINRKPDEKFVILLDESEESRRHTLLSDTLTSKRSLILKSFNTLLQKVFKNNGGIILSDSDLSGSLDFVQDIYETVNYATIDSFIIENEFKYCDRPFQLVDKESELDEYLYSLVKNDKRVIVPCDSKVKGEALAKVLNRDFKDKKIVVIDSDTVKLDYERSFVVNPNATFKEEKPDVLIYTSTMGMGVSIDEKGLFDYVVGYFSGVITIDAIRQSLWRYREQIPVILWCPIHSNSYKENIALYPIEQQKRMLTTSHSNSKTINFDEYLLDTYPFLKTDEDLHEMRVNLWDKENKMYNCPILKHIAIALSQRNYEFKNYRELLIDELINIENFKQVEEFKEVEEFKNGTSTALVPEIIKTEKKEIKDNHYGNIARADDIDFETAEMLNQQENLTKEAEYQISKAFLKRELPEIPITFDFVKWVYSDHRIKLNQVKFSYYCFHPEVSKKLDRLSWDNFRKGCNGFALINDMKTYSHAVKLVNKLGLFDFTYLSDLPIDHCRFKEFRRVALREKAKLRNFFGIYMTKKTDTFKVLTKLMAKIGFSITVKDDLVMCADLCSEYRDTIYNSLSVKYTNFVTSPVDTTGKKSESFLTFSNEQNHMEHSIEGAKKTFSLLITEKKNNQENIIQQPLVLNLEKEGAAAQINQDLLGKKCSFWGKDKLPRVGYIQEFLSFGILIKDENDGSIHPCDRTQIELLDGSVFPDLPQPVAIPEVVVKPVTENYYYHQQPLPVPQYAPINIDQLIPLSNRKDVKIGDVLRSHKGIYSRIIAVDGSQIWVENNPDSFSIKYDTFELFRD